MFLANKFTKLFSFENPVGIIGIFLLVFVVCFIVLLTIAIKTIKLNNVIKELIYNVHILHNSPIKLFLRNSIKALATKPQFEKRVKVWSYWIYRTYTVVFNNLVDQLNELLQNKKPFSIKGKNYTSFVDLNKKFEKLTVQVDVVCGEMIDFTQEETLLRNYIIYLKIFFDSLKEECIVFAINQRGIKIKKMEYAIKKTQEKFHQYYEYLKSAKFELALNLTSEINEYMGYIMDLLDKMPNLLSILNKVIPDKIQRLRKLYLIDPDRDDVKYAYQRISELSFYVQEQSILIMQMLSKLQFISAEKEIINILQRIDNVEHSIENGDRLRIFLIHNLGKLDDIFKTFGQAELIVEKQHLQTYGYDQENITNKNELQILKTRWNSTETKGYKMVSEFYKDPYGLTESQLVQFKNTTTEVFSDLIECCESLVKISQQLANEKNLKAKLIKNTAFMRSVLAQYIIKIKQNQTRIPELIDFSPELLGIKNKLDKYNQTFLDSIDKDQTKLEAEVQNMQLIKEEGIRLMTKIDDNILLDQVCQKLIINLEKNQIKNHALDEASETLESLYKNRKLSAVVSEWTQIMGTLRNKKAVKQPQIDR